MEKVKFESVQPRFLRYRSHYRFYLIFLLVLSGLILSFWGFRLSQSSVSEIYREQSFEIFASACYFMIFGAFYFGWLRSRLNRSVQVYPTHILVHKGRHVEEVKFSEVESYSSVWGSVFYLKTKDGHKHYFSSSLERVDYIWEGFKNSRPDMVTEEVYEEFRLRLVQYDHHQKRKEWFFRHKMVDVFNWLILPCSFLMVAYVTQSRQVVIHQEGLYFFRLFMYSILTLLVTTSIFSLGLKKLIFDKKIKIQMSESGDKLRDLEFEGVVLHRSKLFQTITACFIFALVVKSDMNLFSVTKVKEDLAHFNLKGGRTILVDNRFNCLDCKHAVKDGDLVVFGRGSIGQVMAKEGDLVGQVSQDSVGRMIASESMQEVPRGCVALKSPNGKDIMFVKVVDLIGKIQN